MRSEALSAGAGVTRPGEPGPAIQVRLFPGLQDYADVQAAMQAFTSARTPDSSDEIWVLQHAPVYTLGLNGKAEHILNPEGIPVCHSDRGGQVTYHGPGQWVFYLLLDLRRRQIGVRELVDRMEQGVIDLLAAAGVAAGRHEGAPGVYVQGAKLAALGLRIRKGCSYHGLALNTAMDLSPFAGINPCGYQNLPVIQLADLLPDLDPQEIPGRFLAQLGAGLPGIPVGQALTDPAAFFGGKS